MEVKRQWASATPSFHTGVYKMEQEHADRKCKKYRLFTRVLVLEIYLEAMEGSVESRNVCMVQVVTWLPAMLPSIYLPAIAGSIEVIEFTGNGKPEPQRLGIYFSMAELSNNPRVKKTISKGVLECGVCEDIFAFHGEKVPRLLLCGHTLCHECLTKLPLRNRTVVCPFDRQKTELSDSGVWGLKKNFALLELLERLKVAQVPLVNNFEEDENKVKCDENEEHLASVYCTVCGTNLCSSCSEITHATKTLNKHKRVPISEKPSEKAVCPDHHERIIEFACAEDVCRNNPLMCVLCKDYGKHKGHKHHLVMTEAENVRSSILNAIQHIKLFSEDIAKATQKIETVIQKIEGSVVVEDDVEGQSHSRRVVGTGDTARGRVRDYFNDLRETVNRQEEAGLAVVDSYLRDQLSWLRQRQEDMVVLNSHTSAVCSHCEKTLKSDDSQVVASRSDILNVLQTVQEQQQQFLETAELCSSDGSIPIAFTKDNRVHIGPKMEMRVVALGLDGAGKTSILFKLKQDEFVSTITTIGFNVETIEHKNLKFTIWDVGGLHKLRPLWRHYYLNTQAIIFVVDSNNKERMEESHAELVKLLTEKRLSDALLLVYANKQDLPTALDLDQVTERLCLHKLCCGRSWNVIGCDAHSGRGLREGLDWLATQLMSEFPP